MRQFHIDRAAIPHREIGVRQRRLPRCADVPDGGAWLGHAAARGEGVRGVRGLDGRPGGRARGALRRPWWFDAYEVYGRSEPRIDGGGSGEGESRAPPTCRYRHMRYPHDRGMAGMKKPALRGLSAGGEGRSGEGRAPQLAAVLVHRLDQHRDMLGWRELRDAMSQVEDVAPTRVGRTVAVQRADDLFTHLFG